MKVQYLASLTFSVVLLSAIPAAHAGRIVIPVYQSQVGVNNGTQNQSGGYGSTQTGVLDQSNQQSQAVNVYVPDNYRGSVRTIYLNGGEPSSAARGNSFYNRRDGKGFQPKPR
ncbi:MAG: hypothetical protein H7Y37_15260 [Anaerolineae bacterium]|nr:hypothetical protein [Gloeobacterales cyanobacterium ES-bin-313]